MLSTAPDPSLLVLLRVLLGGFGCRHRRDGFDALEFDPPSRSRRERALPSVTHSLNHNERKETERPFFLGDLSEFEMLEKQLGMHQRLDGREGSPDRWTDHLLCLFCLLAVCLFHRPPPLLSLRPPLSRPFSASSDDNLEYFYSVKVEPIRRRLPPPSLHFAFLRSFLQRPLSHLKQDLTDLTCC